MGEERESLGGKPRENAPLPPLWIILQ